VSRCGNTCRKIQHDTKCSDFNFLFFNCSSFFLFLAVGRAVRKTGAVRHVLYSGRRSFGPDRGARCGAGLRQYLWERRCILGPRLDPHALRAMGVSARGETTLIRQTRLTQRRGQGARGGPRQHVPAQRELLSENQQSSCARRQSCPRR